VRAPIDDEIAHWISTARGMICSVPRRLRLSVHGSERLWSSAPHAPISDVGLPVTQTQAGTM
jgi:hypothetical protein